jgi:hypothetical protein
MKAQNSAFHTAYRLQQLIGLLLFAPVCQFTCWAQPVADTASTEAFAADIERVLPKEEPFDYHKRLSQGPIHTPRRDAGATQRADEMEIPTLGWRIIWKQSDSPVIQGALTDFQDYLRTSMSVETTLDLRDSLENWQTLNQCVVIGTRGDLPGCGAALKDAKDYEIAVTPERVTVCGYDERGVMFGLYNLEARMNLREAPFLPAKLHTIRHSLYDARMVQSWMGWMEFPDAVLAHMAHDGFDAIYASAYANPNNDRTTAENSTDFYARLMYRMRHQNPSRVHDLISRAGRFGIKVYTPLIYQYLGTPESEADLRRFVREIVTEFPDIHGYVLLTEGFWYKKWGGGHGASAEYMQDWAKNWSYAAGVVAEECHRVNPAIEILPWEYNIDFRPQNVDIKRYFIQQLPHGVIPMLTWENGKSFELDGMKGYLRDYAINQVGPAEVTEAQIIEARSRGMKVYSNAQTFVCGAQLQTVPYHPFPYQWHERYKAMDRLDVDGTLESWSTAYTPNIMTEFRAWYCWSEAPPVDELLGAIAAREFGADGKDKVLKAWNLFSQAIRTLPDTGPYMGTGNATGNPLFFEEPPARTATFNYSWMDQDVWMGYLGAEINPYWPFTVSRMVFIPDFTNATNRAESYARSVSGIEAPPNVRVLPVFLKYLRLTTDRFGEGLDLYRAAALGSPGNKRIGALREVVVAEQIHRMLESDQAILEFEDVRLQLAAEKDNQKANVLIDRLEEILRAEISRTELSLLAVSRDSRLGFQFETDYVFTPYSLKEKLEILRDTLDRQLREYRATIGAQPHVK